MAVLGMSLGDGQLAALRLPNAYDMPLAVVAVGILGFATPVAPYWLCSLMTLLGSSGALLVSLLLEPSFLQQTSELSFDPLHISSNQPSHEFACLVLRVQSWNALFAVFTVPSSHLVYHHSLSHQ